MREVRDPECAPDGKWVAYVVSTTDLKEDKRNSHIWMASYDGSSDRQVTFSQDSESSPRWSPDGRYLSFTSSRPGPAKGNQVWILDRNGGEAMQLTDVKGRLQSYEWSPDSKRLAIVMGDPDPEAEQSSGTGSRPSSPPKPIVIDRYKFKQDGQGYLLSGRYSHIYLFTIETKKLERLTTGKFNESSPSWSPDGQRIAFVSNHSKDPDRDPGGQIWLAEAKPGATEFALTPGNVRTAGKPEWSPDGKRITFLESDDKKFGAYNMNHLRVIDTDPGSTPRGFAAVDALDRSISAPRFSADGRWLEFQVTDDMSVYPARIAANGSGAVEKLMKTPIVVSSASVAGGCSVALSGSSSKPTEVYAVENGRLRQLSHQNDELFAQLDIPPTDEVRYPSKDGTSISGLLTYPVGYAKGSRVPLLLWIHGGPNGQDQHSFAVMRHFFAANGYAVLAVNYRGSAGRGQKFSRAIFADWGNYEVQDLLAGVDHVIKLGVADPDKLAVGGWSYGGILTDYLIASDTRFKAATSGAGTAFTVSFYGTDQYIIQYDNEIGPPWNPKSWEIYQKIAYPFLHADRIKTPTLFLCGQRDFNVPVAGSEQMYQALRSLGVETQLVIYPNEGHGIQRPTYQKDRYERYLAWYNKYVRGIEPPPPAKEKEKETSSSASAARN